MSLQDTLSTYILISMIEKYLEQYDWNVYEVDKKDTRGRKRGHTSFKYYFRRHVESDGDSKRV